MLTIGIVVPTYRRRRFWGPFLDNLRRQTLGRFRCVVVHDGPEPGFAETVHRLAAQDPRIVPATTPIHHGNCGIGPRMHGIRLLAALPSPPEYVVMWDDDNLFYPDALEWCEAALERAGRPDVLLVPIDYIHRTLPEGLRDGLPEVVDTACFVVRLDVAARVYPQVAAAGPDPHVQDQTFYGLLRRESPPLRIAVAQEQPIGRYDGLRRMHTWLVRLGAGRLKRPMKWLFGLPGVRWAYARLIAGR